MDMSSQNIVGDGNPCLGCCAVTSKFSTALHFTFTYHLVKVKHLCPSLDVSDTSSGMISASTHYHYRACFRN